MPQGRAWQHAQSRIARCLADPTHRCHDEMLEWARRDLAESQSEYADALCKLKEAFGNMICCDAFETGGSSHAAWQAV